MDNNAKIYSKDSALLKAMAAGKCDVGLVNTYYLGRELKKDANFPVGLFWANQANRGTHVNISVMLTPVHNSSCGGGTLSKQTPSI